MKAGKEGREGGEGRTVEEGKEDEGRKRRWRQEGRCVRKEGI
jgi:hypothetical protein